MPRALALQGVTRPTPAALNVVACGITRQQTARLTDALRSSGLVNFVGSFAMLRALLRASVDAPDVIVIPSRDSAGTSAASFVAELAVTHPRIAIVALCDARSDQSGEIRPLATAGVHQFVFSGIQDEGVALRSIVLAARRQCASEAVARELAVVVPSELLSMIEAVVSRPDAVTTVSHLADVLGLHRKTLFNRCSAARFLPPAELLAWGRLALVAYFLETTGCTLEAIATELSFPSDTALRNSLKRYTGRRATELRACGALRCVVSALSDRIRELRLKSLHVV